MSLSTRFYSKTTAADNISYIYDGEGRIGELVVKLFSFSAQVANGSTLNIPLANSKAQISGLMYQLQNNGAIINGAHTFIPNYGACSLDVTATGADIPADAILTVSYIIN